jgi:hypothetical protein
MAMNRRFAQWFGAACATVLALASVTARADALRPPFNMTQVAHVPLSAFDSFAGSPTSVQDARVEGNFVYVSAVSTGTYILNIANPSSPQFVGFYSSAVTEDFPVDNGLLFTGGRIIDVRDPAHPSALTDLTYGGCHTMAYYSALSLLYCAAVSGDVRVYWLYGYDPDNPPETISPFYNIAGNQHSVAVHNNIYFGSAGDVRLASAPGTLMGTINGVGGHSISPTEDHKFVVSTSEGIKGKVHLSELYWSDTSLTSTAARDTFSVDAGAQFWPPPAGSTAEYGSPHEVVVTPNDYAYVSYYEAGIKVLKIRRSSRTLKLAASFDTSTIAHPGDCCSNLEGAWGVRPVPNSRLVLVVDEDEGLFILRHFSLEEVALLITSPT